ncbi:hypothetical protein TH47_11500 [Thalassospira sp. MCCC 1A02803]|nr:hypothetical protein TH47_11500 [Thalassospira sp. MCCC 1A02803]
MAVVLMGWWWRYKMAVVNSELCGVKHHEPGDNIPSDAGQIANRTQSR